MKKLLFLLISFVFFACEGPTGPMGPAGEDGVGSNWFMTSFTINKNDWKLVGNPNDLNSYFYVEKKMKELTKSVYETGTVLGYIQSGDNAKNGLPYVLHRGASDSKGEFLWTQTYDFDFSEQVVRFYVTYSDFTTSVKPDREIFHVILIW